MKETYLLVDEFGNRKIVRKDNKSDKTEYLSDYIAFIGFSIVDDYLSIANGEKERKDTNIDFKISVLNALSNATSLERF